MSRTWKHFGLTALLLLVVTLTAQGEGEDQGDKNSDKFQGAPPTDLAKQLEQLNKTLKEIQGQLRDLKDLPERVKTLEGAFPDPLKISGLEEQVKNLTRTVGDLGSQVKNLQEMYQRLDDRLRAQDARVARAFEPRPTPAGAIGTIKLQNRSGVSATVVVNNQAYVLGPYETRLLENRPAGSFTYEVMADLFGVIQAPVTRTLNPEETFVIQINR